MNFGRMQSISILGSLSVIFVFSAGRAFSQTRPGINAFVKAPEGCSYSDPLDTNDLYGFMKTQIQALSLARAGESGALHIQTTGKSSNPSADRFAGLKEERIGDTCAGFILSPFIKSENKTVASVARRLAADYGELGKMTDERLGIAMQQSLQTHYGKPVQARLSDLKKKREDIMRDMNDVLPASLSLLIDHNQTDIEGKPGRMILTHDQRISLRDFLQSQFPSLLIDDKIGTKPTDEFTKQASVIRTFLAGNYAPSARQ